ncbi:transposase [Streptomyces sp. V4-01]|uniref:Transposase n=1 Tax=Actinacidiphila polyblastidii TaxID=3110430 RepID=A0ABU7PB63_9ACTN|nr:transposase [Streptomyces sp. V4-01]
MSEGDPLAQRLVSDALWAVVEPLLPRFEPRRQGGGSAPLDERAAFTAVVYVLTHGCAWRQLPASFRVSAATAHRRYASWTRTGLWERLRGAALDRRIAGQPDRDWVAAIVGAATTRSAEAVGRSAT